MSLLRRLHLRQCLILTTLLLLLLLASTIATAHVRLVSSTAFASSELAENSWVSKTPMPTARKHLGVAVVNGKIYAIGGCDHSGYLDTNEMYDPKTDTWDKRASMPTPRCDFGIAVYQNKIYVIGGFAGYKVFFPHYRNVPYTVRIATKACEVYDPATNTWETRTPMPTPRAEVCANVLNGRIYLTAGYTKYPEETYALNEVYDPSSDKWTRKLSLLKPVRQCSSAVVDDIIYVISAEFTQVYDPAKNAWTFGMNLPVGVRDAAAGATTGVNAPMRIYVIGGNTNQVYNPESNTWTTGASMPTGRYGLAIAVVDDVLYAIGGDSSGLVGISKIFGENGIKNEQYTSIGYEKPEPSPVSPSPTTTPFDSEPEPFPTMFVTVAAVSVAIVSISFIVYFKKHKR